MKTSLLVTFLFIACTTQAVAAEKFPPGWLPVSELDDQPTWSEFREIKDRIHLYQPWTLPARKLEPGLRVLFAVGVKADGSHSASQPAIVIVK